MNGPAPSLVLSPSARTRPVLTNQVARYLTDFLQQNGIAVLRDYIAATRLNPLLLSQITTAGWTWDNLQAREQQHLNTIINQPSATRDDYRELRRPQIRQYQTSGFSLDHFLHLQVSLLQILTGAAIRVYWWRPTVLQAVLDGLLTYHALDQELAHELYIGMTAQHLNNLARQVGEAIDQLGQASQHIAYHTRNLGDVLSGTLDYAQQGHQNVGQSVQGMEGLRQSVTDLANRTVDLSQQLGEISTVLDLIKEVTAETDILAINASVEAASAGEIGERFGVVASEIRTLSDRVRDSASQIERLVYEVQAAAKQAVRAADVTVADSQSGVTLAHQASEAVAEVVLQMQDTSSTLDEINEATRQQALAVNDVAVTIREIARTLTQLEGSFG